MRYPKHLILDLSTPTHSSYTPNWKTNFVSRTSVKLTQETSQYLKSVSNHSYTSLLPTATVTPILSSFTTSTFDINFLRKEKIYTKLKYSRCPQYDIVSGGFAAILAGFIGFLISEKFGIELVDSGDFYIAFMYGVFAVFSLRPLVRIYSKDNVAYTPVSLKYLTLFLRDLLLLVIAELYFWASKLKPRS